MPIGDDEFDQGLRLTEVERDIVSYLKKNNGRAFNAMEVLDGLGYKLPKVWGTNEPILNGLKWMGITAGFNEALEKLVKAKRLEKRVIEGISYYRIRRGT